MNNQGNTQALSHKRIELIEIIKNSISDNSRIALESDAKNFILWGGKIPCDVEMIVQYLLDHAEQNAVATLKRRLASISKAHTLRGCESPVSDPIVKMTMRGIERQFGKPQYQVKPLLKEDLINILNFIPDKYKGTRDKALLMIGFCAALRRSEIVTIKLCDLEFIDRGLILTLPRSKTDQTGQGRKIAIPYGRGNICPVQAIKDWIEILGQPEYLFPAITKGGEIKPGHISDRTVADIIKSYAKKAGLEYERYSGHSLRAGLATSASMHGVSSHKIRQQTGHKSDEMLSRYIRDGDIFIDNAAGSLF